MDYPCHIFGELNVRSAEEYMEMALESEYGIAIKCEFIHVAEEIRRDMYRVRSRARDKGKIDYEDLSFFVQGDGQLIIRRKPLEPYKALYGYVARELGPKDFVGHKMI